MTSAVKLLPLASPLATLLASAALFSEARGQTSQLVYSQNFNSAAIDTTGTGLNDGSNMVDNIANYAHNRVWYSTSWGSLPAGQEWKALFMTPMAQGILSNFFGSSSSTHDDFWSFLR